jgi:hypothetical protein
VAIRVVGPLAQAPRAFGLEHPLLHQECNPPHDVVRSVIGPIRLDGEALGPDLLAGLRHYQLRIDDQPAV